MANFILGGADILQTLLEWADFTPSPIQYESIRNGYHIAVTEDEDRVLRERIGDAISYDAMIAWTTSGHVGVDVQLFGWGAVAERVLPRGVVNNIDLGELVAREFDLDLDPSIALNLSIPVHLKKKHQQAKF